MKKKRAPKNRLTSASEQNNKLKVKSKKLIVILGPTATGKTKLAVKLAGLFNGEIISADSRQVYQGMDIGTGKDLKEYRRAPYHLIDIASPKKQFTLAEYQKTAYQAIDHILNKNRIPFLVGGTGLYLQSIIEGYQLSESGPDMKLRAKLNNKSLAQLQRLSQKLNFKLNSSDFNNKRRLTRAIEIKLNDKNFNQTKCPKYDCLVLGLKYSKDIIDKRIDLRLQQRLKQGLIAEVKKLKKVGLSWKRLEDFGLEYKWISLYLQNKINYDEMVNRLRIAIHQFAKRQLTWFKRMKNIIWLKDDQQALKLIQKFLN